jgi:hypothetical protein
MARLKTISAALVLMASAAACTDSAAPAPVAAERRSGAGSALSAACDGGDPYESLMSQPEASEVSMVQTSIEQAQRGAQGDEALQVVNHSNVPVGYGPEVILQRSGEAAWTNVAQSFYLRAPLVDVAHLGVGARHKLFPNDL